MISVQDIEKIEKYLEGKLAGAELTDFQQQLSTNPELAEMADSFKFAIEGVRVYNRNQLKYKLGQIQKEVSPILNKQSSNTKYYVGGGFVALLVALFFIINPFSEQVNNNVSKQNIDVEETIIENSQNQVTDNSNTILEIEGSQKDDKAIATHNVDNNNLDSKENQIVTVEIKDEIAESSNVSNDNQNPIASTNPAQDNKRSDDFPEAQFSSGISAGCVPIRIEFSDNSSIPNGIINRWLWEFGDGSKSTAQNPEHTYKTAGIYSVKLTVWSNNGNSDVQLKENLTTVYLVPDAGFKTDPEIVIVNKPDVIFINTTKNTTNKTSYKWDFGDHYGSSTKKDPEYRFIDTGSYIVSLTAISENACMDKAVRGIIVVPEVSCYRPSAFSPNGVGPEVNNTYRVIATGFTEFYIIIYSRHGEVVYESKEYKSHGWDGKHVNTGSQNNEAEVFMAKVRLIGFDGKEYNYRQSITLIR